MLNKIGSRIERKFCSELEGKADYLIKKSYSLGPQIKAFEEIQGRLSLGVWQKIWMQVRLSIRRGCAG